MLRRILLPVLALGLAVATAVYARGWLESQRHAAVPAATAPAAATKTVMVANSELAPGTLLQPGHLRWQPWPDVAVPDSYILEGDHTEEELLGSVVRHPLAAGQPVSRGNLVRPGDHGFLAAVLTPGTRALSVPVNDASSNAGLIFPGDRVDLIVTHSLGDDERGGQARRASETVLEDVRVIAMGRRLTGSGGDDASGQVRTTTLEVSPVGAEKVALATELGKLSLSLRSLATPEDDGAATVDAVARPVTWDVDVSRALDSRAAPAGTIVVLRGGSAANGGTVQ
ncbi:Flp pilus assembly protein CpaB [Geminicoccaceae bacterium 1502E]|nr:Flp pilus assembly protein CpaB [Geminicoccaceae bacterium 1502E]